MLILRKLFSFIAFDLRTSFPLSYHLNMLFILLGYGYLQLEGTIIAPTNAKAWGGGLLQWLEFTKLRGITIRGKGVIEGRGSVWWTGTDDDIDPVRASRTFLSLLFCQ